MEKMDLYGLTMSGLFSPLGLFNLPLLAAGINFAKLLSRLGVTSFFCSFGSASIHWHVRLYASLSMKVFQGGEWIHLVCG